MKVTDNSSTISFKPIEITITIESSDELQALWKRFNYPPKAVKEDYVDDFIHKEDIVDIYNVWSILNNYAEDRKLRP